MKKILAFFFTSIFFVLPVFSQNTGNNGGEFTKRIEYNKIVFVNNYNFNSKGTIEKQFFGDFNAPFEFFFDPSFAWMGRYGFRLIQDSLMNNILEIKFTFNLEGTQKKVHDKYPIRTVSSTELASMPKDSLNLIGKQNTENIQKAITDQIREQGKLSPIDSRSFPVSNQFAEILYKKAVSLIDNFKATGIKPLIEDCYTATFRTVVDDEVWSLAIHCPAADALKMTNLYKQIIFETLSTEKVDETTYIKLLVEFN